MNDDVEKMTIQEALHCIKHHFTENEGLIAQIERGQPIDSIEVKKLEVALQQLHMAWMNLDLVPKQEVQMLWNVVPRLERCLLLYPEKEVELSRFMYDVIVWFDQLFMTELMSGEHAIAMVSQHVIAPSFLVDIQLSRTTTTSGVDDVFTAVETLAQIWKHRTHISKLAAGALLGTQSMTISDYYPEDERQRLQEIMQQLREHITKCWE